MRRSVAGLIVLSVVCGLLAMAPNRLNASFWVDDHGGCTTVPHESPCGKVQSCRLLDNEVRWFSDVDASAYLLLETDRGLVVIRVDYRDVEMGRHYSARAAELTPDQASGELSAEELQRLTAAVAARGGVRNEEWTIIYGDG